MNLRDLLDGLHGATMIGEATVEIREIRNDSREVMPGDLFVAVRGMRADGHAFVPVALERGAAAIVVERELPGVAVPQVIVPDGSIALGLLVARSFGNPAQAMTLIGITGTNGKTTTTYIVEAILTAAGFRPGVVGTVEYRWHTGQGHERAAPYTTPTPQILHGALAQMRDAGCTHVVMEVTSSALAMDRVAGMQFAVAAFSNLTQDHLDVHGTMDAYRDAKRRLFSDHLRGTAVVNVDDPEGAGMAAAATGKVLRVSAAGREAELAVVHQDSSVRGIEARIATPRGELAVQARPLLGHYNVENLALAVGIAEALALPHEVIARGVAALPGVPGRVERIANQAELDVIVDYAHTPDALHNVLAAVRPLTRRRLICVFGCGGDRDPTKRPKMGAAVAALADLAIVTSDNPRTEDPRAIIDQILPGVPRPFAIEVDRRTAIRVAIAEATPGDVVVIAGKGHEDYQILGTTKHHFDDREEAAAAIAIREHRSVGELAREAEGVAYGEAGRSRGDRQPARGTRRAVRRDPRRAARRPRVLPGRARGRARPSWWRRAAGRRAEIVVDDTRLAIGQLEREHRRRWRGRLSRSRAPRQDHHEEWSGGSRGRRHTHAPRARSTTRPASRPRSSDCGSFTRTASSRWACAGWGRSST